MNLAGCSLLQCNPETHIWFRAVQPQHWTTSLATAQTRMHSSRFDAGLNASPQFEVLYLAEDPLVALFEVGAVHGSPLQPGSVVASTRQAWTVINVTALLQKVADLTENNTQTSLTVSAQELTGDWRGYQSRSAATSVSQPVGIAPTQELGQALFAVPDLEGFHTISAKVPYSRNLVVFPQKLMSGSRIEFHHPQTGQRYIIRP